MLLAFEKMLFNPEFNEDETEAEIRAYMDELTFSGSITVGQDLNSFVLN